MKTLTASLLLLGAGCAAVPSQAQIEEAERTNAWGPKPEVGPVEAFVRARLKDPESMRQYYCGPPEKSFLVKPATWTSGAEPLWHWRSFVQYNAKNSFGGYVGLKSAHVYYDKGRPAYWMPWD